MVASGTIARVEFYQGQSLIGTATAAPYSFAWTNVASGSYSLTAAVVDSNNVSTSSSAITVKVNAAPTITITSPATGANATAPANITVSADAIDTDGTIAKVQFYRNGVAITTLTAAPYSFTWTSVPAGSYVLTAVATDDLGSSTTSAQVTLTVGAGGAQTYFIETDHLNTPRVIEDKSQNLVWSWDNTEPSADSMPNDNPSGLASFDMPLRFKGQYADKETARSYNMHRDYDSTVGRYIESDPIGLRGGLNTYSYALDNSLTFVDPSGLVTWSGTSYSFGLVDNAGVIYTLLDLFSECRCGRKYHILVHAPAVAVGLGVKVSATISNVSFDDGQSCPDPTAFLGPYLSASAGVTGGALPFPTNPKIGLGLPGIGGGVGMSRYGSVYSNIDSAAGVTIGRDMSVTGGVGVTFMNVLDVKKCCE